MDILIVIALGVALYFLVWEFERKAYLRFLKRQNDAAIRVVRYGLAGHTITVHPSDQCTCSCGVWCRNEDAADAHLETVACNKWRESHEWDEQSFDREWADLQRAIEDERGEQEDHR